MARSIIPCGALLYDARLSGRQRTRRGADPQELFRRSSAGPSVSKTRRFIEQTEDFWSKGLPNVAYNLDVVRFYREMYGYIAEYLDRGSHRSDPSGADA
jgi:hypothetical protein